MLDHAKNRLLTQVGGETPMGELLRRYWMPIAAVSEFDSISIRPVRLMGEDLTLYKDLSGAFGLVDRHCPHRRADLSYGFVEECGLRCNIITGWRSSPDETGRCGSRTTLGRRRRAGSAVQRQNPDQGLSGESQGRPALGLSGTAARASGARLGGILMGERLCPDRLRGCAMQLVAMPGEFNRSTAFRVDAH